MARSLTPDSSLRRWTGLLQAFVEADYRNHVPRRASKFSMCARRARRRRIRPRADVFEIALPLMRTGWLHTHIRVDL